MEYEKMTKIELIAKLEQQRHLASAVEAKDAEISKLKSQLEINQKDLIAQAKTLNERAITEANRVTVVLTEKHNAELKVLGDSLAAAQLKYDALDALRLEQVSKLSFAHGDLLKSLQSITDSHLKLNNYIIIDISGGENNG